ncbi:MAG: hypothetical protein ACD_84C00038G0011 [uncultured bacterium]|nr:MAG: hypothetical protein ACD_84C00038G0011 [uncultured bacterium]
MNLVLLDKALLRMRLKYQLFKQKNPKYANRTTRKICEEYLGLLSPSIFNAYKPPNGLITFVRTPYKNLGEFTKKLIATNLLLKQSSIITPDWDNGAYRNITVDRFLITSEGFYADNVKAIADFKQAGLELCKLMVESDTAEFGKDEHNSRMLTKLFINLLEVAVKLNIVSVE